MTSTDEIWGSDEAAPYLRSVPCKFDEEEPWSSWIVELPWKMLEDRIREKGKGTVLRSVTVTRRSESGAATALEAVSDKDSCIIENEYEIRKFLAPVNCMITEKMEQKQQEEVFFQVLILNWRERRMEISRSEEKDMDMVSE